MGWSIDNAQDSNLVVNALDMAIKNRQPAAGRIIHADHGVQFISWAVTNKIRTPADLANAMFEYIEIFHNRQRQPSKLGYVSPTEHEPRLTQTSIPA